MRWLGFRTSTVWNNHFCQQSIFLTNTEVNHNDIAWEKQHSCDLRMAEQSNPHKFWANIQEIVRMFNRLE